LTKHSIILVSSNYIIGTDCLLQLGLLIASVLLGLDLKLTYLQKPMSPNISVTQHL